METKKCSGCGEIKLLSEFHNYSRNTDGKKARCKTCKTEESKKRWQEKKDVLILERKRNIEKYREYSRKSYHKCKYNHEEKRRKADCEKIKNLSDSYVKLTLYNQGILYKDMSKELIELKRAIITAKRELKSAKQ